MPVNVPNRYRNWCFTLNNPTEDEMKRMIPLPSQPEPEPFHRDVRYLKFQLEKGANGTPHFQGVLHMNGQKRLSSMKTLLPRAHLEPCRNLKASIAYCEKEDTRLEGPWD